MHYNHNLYMPHATWGQQQLGILSADDGWEAALKWQAYLSLPYFLALVRLYSLCLGLPYIILYRNK